MKIVKSQQIKIYPKHTSADTQYYDMEPEDEAFLYQWMYRFLADMSEICTHDEDIKKEWFKRRPGVFPKGKQGPNSYASVLGGICAAKLKYPEKNLSEPQLNAVELIFDMISDYYKDEPNAPKSVSFHKQFFSEK